MKSNASLTLTHAGVRLQQNSIYLLVAVVGMLALALCISTVFVPELLFISVGICALFIMLLPPLLLPDYGLWSPWSLMTLVVIIWFIIRGVYITFEIPDPETIDELFIRGQTPDFFIGSALLILTGMAAMVVGYFSGRKHRKRAVVRRRWRCNCLYVIALVILVVSLCSTLYYIRFTDGFRSEQISAKRTTLTDVDLSGTDYHNYGVLRTLAGLAIFPYLLVLGDGLRPTATRRMWKLSLAAALFLAASILPFYSSSRAPIALNVCVTAAMLYYSGRTIPIARMAVLAIVAFAVVHVMTVLRKSPVDSTSWLIPTSAVDVLSSVVLNRSCPEVCTTGHIVNAIPDVLEFQYGKTIWGWFVAPVPRELWPDKPLIQSGPIIGTEVYGNRVSGVPPGYIAEMYWNFHFPGVIVGCFLLGLAIRNIDERLRPGRGDDPFIVAFYVAGPMQIGYAVFGHSLGFGVFRTIISTAIMAGLLWFIRDRR